MSIGDRLTAIKKTLPQGVRLVAVSKFHPSEAIVEAYEAGQRVFGESRVQELLAKNEELGAMYLDLVWHFIGPLQTNKVKYIAPFVHVIESVTSLKLLDEINKQAIRHRRVINVLLEVHIAEEESKGGFSPEELLKVLEHIQGHADEYRGIRICGLMGMATYTEDVAQIDREFAELSQLMQNVKDSGLLLEPDEFDELSMGMSGDYPIAIKHGATLVRIGSAIFGVRGE